EDFSLQATPIQASHSLRTRGTAPDSWSDRYSRTLGYLLAADQCRHEVWSLDDQRRSGNRSFAEHLFIVSPQTGSRFATKGLPPILPGVRGSQIQLGLRACFFGPSRRFFGQDSQLPIRPTCLALRGQYSSNGLRQCRWHGSKK